MSYDLKDKDVAKLKLETNPSYYDGYTKAIVAKRNDINSRYLHVDIYASGKEVDITKFSPSMNIKTPTEEHFSVNGQIINNELYFKIYDSLLKDVGHLSCDISLYRECTNVTLDTDGSIYYEDIKLTQNKFINQVENIGTYIFEYDGSDWKLDGNAVVMGDYGIEIGVNINPIAQDKIIVSYSNYMLLTTETFFIAIQDNIYSDDSQIPTDEENRVFDYIDANDILVAIEQSHVHDNKDILDATTAPYTIEDKTKLKNIDTNLYVEKATMGRANGVATLDNSGLVPAGQLPSFVDDVIESYIVGTTEFANNWLSLTEDGSALTPEKGKIYVIVSEGNYKNKQYRWGGSIYVLCNPSDVNSVNGKTGVVSINLDDIPNGETNVHTVNNFTDELKNKLNGIEDGAQANVTPDWNATKEEKGYIANKPIIPEGSQLYDSTGDNTDGSMTQKAITDAIENYPATVFAESERQKSKNLAHIYKSATDNNAGLTITSDPETQIITVNGAATRGVDLALRNFIYPWIQNCKGKKFTLSARTLDGKNADSVGIFLTTTDINIYDARSAGFGENPQTFEIPNDYTYASLIVYSPEGATFDNYQFRIQIEEGEVTATDWSYPYGAIMHANDKEIAFAREEYNKSRNLWDSKNIINHPDNATVTYSSENDTYSFTIDYAVSGTNFTILPYNDHINKYGFLPAGDYTLSFKTTNVNDLSAPVIVAKLTNYGKYETAVASIYITTDGYYTIQFTLSESTRIGIAWYYNAEWTGNTTPAGTKTLSNIQLEKGTEATEFHPYYGDIVHRKELKDYTGTFWRNTGGIEWGELSKTDYTEVLRLDDHNVGSMCFANKDQKTYMQLDGTLFVNEGNDEVATLSGAQTITGAKTFTSDITLTKSSPIINLVNTGANGNTMIRFTRSDTEKSCQFGIDTGGTNRGFWDTTQDRWIIYCDDSKANLNSITVPSGQTLTINGSIIV